MYTVIICSKKIIEDCNITYNAFLQPLIDDGEWTFCEWNHEGDSIDEAVPTLERTVAKYRNWRAIIVNDIEVSNFEEISKKNPFDFAGSIPMPKAFNTVDEIKFFREDKEKAFRKAVTNPMTKLTSWLLGAFTRIKEKKILAAVLRLLLGWNLIYIIDLIMMIFAGKIWRLF